MPAVALSTQSHINALVYGNRWERTGAGADISFSFAGPASVWAGYASPGEPFQGFAALGGTAQAAVREALGAWSSVAWLRFAELADNANGNGQIRLATTTWQMGSQQLAYTYLPNDLATGGDVWLNSALAGSLFMDMAPGTLGYFTVLHELGHALGLKHPGEVSAASSDVLPALENTLFNSVMSTYVLPGLVLDPGRNIDRLPTTPMSYDIDAMQYLYGANIQWHGSDDVYAFRSDARYLQTIYDTGGTDTIEIDGTTGGRIDLRPGAWNRLGIPVQLGGGAMENPDTVQIYHSSLIENARGGAGSDHVVGNDLPNRLQGEDGDDILVGGAGNDTLDGGGGVDTVDYGDATGAVTAELWRAFALSDGQGTGDMLIAIEGILGSPFGDLLGGSTGNNLLNGGAGDDGLYAAAGSDTLIGGTGNDTLDGGGGADLADYRAASGAVTGELWRFCALDDGQGGRDALWNIEGLIGSDFGDVLAGSNSGDDILWGGPGNDGLYAADGTDTLNGGPGNDTLDGGPGSDLADYRTASGAVTAELWRYIASSDGQGGQDALWNIERLAGSPFADLLAGADGDNLLDGGAGNDGLYAAGGTDTLLGGAGNDTLDGGSGADVADYRAAGSGVIAELWRFLASNDGQGGQDALWNIENLIGSDLADLLAGTDGDNQLVGLSGSDQLHAAGGSDTLSGGLGDDTLHGGTGGDTFLFESSPGAGNLDVILDFSVADDTIQLASAAFPSLGTAGPLAPGQLRAGPGATQAADADDFLIYNSSTGALSYDPDGAGAIESIQFATVGPALNLTLSDFTVI